MAKTQTFDADNYCPTTGMASGNAEDAFKFKMSALKEKLSLVQLPLLPSEKAGFLSLKEQPQVGSLSHSIQNGTRLPWWSVLAQLEKCDSSNGQIHFANLFDEKCQASIRAIFSDLLRHDVNPHVKGKYIFTIPNFWQESVQDQFLQFLPCGRNNAQLLWRPVAVLMACLNDQTQSSPKTLSGKRVLVLDFGNCSVEATRLTIKMDEGYAVPVRQNLKSSNSKRWDYPPADGIVALSLCSSTASADGRSLFFGGFASQVLGQPKAALLKFFSGKAGSYQSVRLSASERNDLLEKVLSEPISKKDASALNDLVQTEVATTGGSVQETIKSKIVPWIKEHGLPDIVAISGALSDVMLEDQSVGDWVYRELLRALPALKKSTVLLANRNSASKGALLYGQREQLGLPTYFDVLPKYEVYVMQKALGEMPRAGATELVANAEVRGGQVWIPEDGPIKGFSIIANKSEFELFVRREDEPWKSIPSDKFPQLEQDESVLIYPEMKPASGYAVVTIRPKDNPDMFGKKKQLVLRWDKGVEKETPAPSDTFAYPFVEWTEGRLAENISVQSTIEQFVSNWSRREIKDSLWSADIKQLESVMVPYRENQNNYSEPYRGAFGNQAFSGTFDKELVQAYGETLLEALHGSDQAIAAGSPQQKTIRLLGFMYSYAPKDFRKYLKASFRSGYVPTMNELIAAGRTFKTADEVNSLLEYMTSLRGLPETDLGWYWWSFFRCMYYNPTAANANNELAGKYFQKMVQFLDAHKSSRVPNTGGPNALYNQLKFCLCAILYGLRIREVNPNFLSTRTTVFKNLNSIVSEMKTTVVFLRAMLDAMPPDRRREAQRMGLNGVVLEFLNNKASAETVSILADFTKTIK